MVHLQTQNGVAKTHRRGDWFDIWPCARNRRCHFDICQCQMTRGKIVLDGKSGEKLWNTVLLSGVLILLDCVCIIILN